MSLFNFKHFSKLFILVFRRTHDAALLGIAAFIHTQTVFIIKKIEEALRELGAELSDGVRTRIFTTDIGRWRDIARAHAEFFGATKPVTSMIQISKLIDPEMMVEIEADAMLE